MNLTNLKYFIDAVKFGSIKKAAEVNFVSSPAISTAIKQLEIELEVNLISHERNRFRPTEKGILLCQQSQKLFSDYNEIIESLHDEVKIEGDLTIATQQSIAGKYLADIFRLLKEQYPNLNLVFKTGTTGQNKKWLEDGIVDIALMVHNVDLKQFEVKVVKDGNFVVVGRTKKLLPLFITETTKETVHLQKKYKKHFKNDLPINCRISSWGIILSFAEAGLGSTYIPDYLLKDSKVKPVFPKTSPLNYPYEIVCTANNGNLSRSKQSAFVDACIEAFKI